MKKSSFILFSNHYKNLEQFFYYNINVQINLTSDNWVQCPDCKVFKPRRPELTCIRKTCPFQITKNYPELPFPKLNRHCWESAKKLLVLGVRGKTD